MTPQLTIIEDSREQQPLDFTGFRGVESVRSGLKTGDYSIQGYEDKICFERKSAPDLISTLSAGHERFLREIDRMKDFEEKYILIEREPSVVCYYCTDHGWDAKYNTAINALLAYACHAQIRVKFFPNRRSMASYIVAKSREFVKRKEMEESLYQPKSTKS